MELKSEIIDITPFEDSRGTLKKILMQSQLESCNIEEVYLIYTCKGGVRGNHYHKTTMEYFTVVSGRATIALQDLAAGAIRKLELSADDNKTIKVPPWVAHAFKNQAEEPLIILAVSTREYSKLDPDNFPFTIL
jgi:dTDP-4-dehydrorhamnose 3,5-epimerase